jgi:hypothetical protein
MNNLIWATIIIISFMVNIWLGIGVLLFYSYLILKGVFDEPEEYTTD